MSSSRSLCTGKRRGRRFYETVPYGHTGRPTIRAAISSSTSSRPANWFPGASRSTTWSRRSPTEAIHRYIRTHPARATRSPSATPGDNQWLIELLKQLNETKILFPATGQKTVFRSRTAKEGKGRDGSLEVEGMQIMVMLCCHTPV